jgi:hypothetical protein
MNAVVIARTASGATYVLAASTVGVHWCRLPSPTGMGWTASGWEEAMPRVVEGERLLVGNLRSSRVTHVEVLPA